MMEEEKKELEKYIEKNSSVKDFLRHIKVTKNYTNNTIDSYQRELIKYFSN